MYYYIYDTFLSDKKYEKTIDKIKTRLLDLEIQGKHERLTLLKSIDELINDEAKRGANTVVLLGNDKTFLKVVDAVAKNNITLGMIPIGENNNLAECLGVPMEDAACDVLAARKTVRFDLGRVGGQYFFSNVKITKSLDRVSILKDNYKIVPQQACVEADIYNFYFPRGEEKFERKMKNCSAQDQKLELVIKTKPKRAGWFRKKSEAGANIDSIIQSGRFEVKSFEYLPVLLDDYKVMKTPITVEVEPKKLNVIVGKNRLKNIQ